jgi:hypothetical protein
MAGKVSQNQPSTDKWLGLAVQNIFQKSEKKTCHPMKC